MTDYEPGTVAVATVRGLPNVRVMRRECFKLASDAWHRDWAHTATQGFTCSNDEDVTDVRPLVTLDLSDAATTVGDLRAAAEEFEHRFIQPETAARLSILADQIEAQTKPPKPAEPTGLGAVVEDADGSLLVRLPHSERPWSVDGITRWSYADIDAVRVLSEGVQQ